MIKIVLAILILLAGFKIIADNSRYAHKHSIADVASQDEENNSKKEEHKPGKADNEDIFYTHFEINLHTKTIAGSAPCLRALSAYDGLPYKPETPPPNFI